MDSSARDSKVNPITDLEPEEIEAGMNKVNDSEAQSLLGNIKGAKQEEEKDQPKRKRKVKWKDTNGNKLAEIVEFLPSDVSDSDEEEVDFCFCTIM